MLVDKISINVGDKTTIYIEMYSLDTPEAELQYGDCKYGIDKKMYVWYGESDDSETLNGWVHNEWSSGNYSSAIVDTVARANVQHTNVIYRIKNNDVSFNESEYVTTLAENTNV